MKKILICLLCMFICVLGKAATETINWRVDGNTYATTTCQTGGDITLPPAPTKYGYTFQGWVEYVFLEYIESTGTQYIDTGITFNKDTDYGKIKTKLSIPDLSTAGYIGADGNVNILWSGGKMYTGGGSASSGYSINPDTSYDIQAEIESARSNRTITIDNTTLIGTPAVYTTKIAIFGAGGQYGTVINLSKAKVYNFSIYKNNTLVFNGIPAKNSSNILGMYDTVTDTFFTNAGTGEFIAGPVINQ